MRAPAHFQARQTTRQRQSDFPADGGGGYHQHSHINHTQGTSACRIHGPPGVPKAGDTEAGSEPGLGAPGPEGVTTPWGSLPSGALQALLCSRQLPGSGVPAGLWELEDKPSSQSARVAAGRAGDAFVQRTRCPLGSVGQFLTRASGIPAHSTLGRDEGRNEKLKSVSPAARGPVRRPTPNTPVFQAEAVNSRKSTALRSSNSPESKLHLYYWPLCDAEQVTAPL